MQWQSSVETIRFTWIATHQRKVNENKSKEEKNFDSIQITMKEKTYLHLCHPQYKLALILHETRLSSQLHKENRKLHEKKNKKLH